MKLPLQLRPYIYGGNALTLFPNYLINKYQPNDIYLFILFLEKNFN